MGVCRRFHRGGWHPFNGLDATVDRREHRACSLCIAGQRDHGSLFDGRADCCLLSSPAKQGNKVVIRRLCCRAGHRRPASSLHDTGTHSTASTQHRSHAGKRQSVLPARMGSDDHLLVIYIALLLHSDNSGTHFAQKDPQETIVARYRLLPEPPGIVCCSSGWLIGQCRSEAVHDECARGAGRMARYRTVRRNHRITGSHPAGHVPDRRIPSQAGRR